MVSKSENQFQHGIRIDFSMQRFQGLSEDSFFNTQKWIVWGASLSDTLADKVRDFIGKGRPGGEQQVKGTRESCFATWLALSGFYGDGISFQIVSGQSFWLRVLPGGVYMFQPRWIPARKILGGWQDKAPPPSSFWPLPNSSELAFLQDIQWAGASSLLWLLLNFPGYFWWQHPVFFYRDLLLWDSSGKWLSSCLAKAGGQWFPNKIKNKTGREAALFEKS